MAGNGICLGLLLLVAAAASARAAEELVAQSITLRDCVERALAHNLDVRIEKFNPEVAQWGIVLQRATFEPALTGQVLYQDAIAPATTLGLVTNAIITERTLTLSSGINGVLPTGTKYNLAALDTRDDGTLSPEPQHVGDVALMVTQPLLRNAWLDANLAQLRVAKKSKQIADQVFYQQVITSVSDAQNAYYDLLFAIENHSATVEDLGRAQALLKENRRRVEVGVLSPLDVTQAEAGVAEREEAVIITEQAIRTAENALKRLISGDVSEFRGVRLVPADRPPLTPMVLDVANSINTALELRPDYLQAKEQLEKQGILVTFNHNQLWPQVDLQGSYGLNGSGTTFGGLTDSIASRDNPAWSIGVIVTIPLGNQAARANYNSAKLQQDQAVLSLKRVEQQIIVDVDNAVATVETNRKRIDATVVATRLAKESLDAEVEKLKAGTSTSFLVLQAQSQLAAAQAAEIQARSDYSKSLVDLRRVEGSTLKENGIKLD